jgi:hypothetical protein
MRILREIQRRIRYKQYGVDLASEINAVVSANVGERSQQPGPERKDDDSERSKHPRR